MLVQLNEELHIPTDLSLPRSPGRLQFYLKRKTIQPRSSLFMLPDKGLQRSLEMQTCSGAAPARRRTVALIKLAASRWVRNGFGFFPSAKNITIEVLGMFLS